MTCEFAKVNCEGTQAPLTHAFPAEHWLPHMPQFVALFVVFSSQPSAGLLLQSAKPGSHDPIPHALPVQVADALAGTGHALPQAPQWDVFDCVSTSHPSAAFKLQSP